MSIIHIAASMNHSGNDLVFNIYNCSWIRQDRLSLVPDNTGTLYFMTSKIKQIVISIILRIVAYPAIYTKSREVYHGVNFIIRIENSKRQTL